MTVQELINMLKSIPDDMQDKYVRLDVADFSAITGWRQSRNRTIVVITTSDVV